MKQELKKPVYDEDDVNVNLYDIEIGCKNSGCGHGCVALPSAPLPVPSPVI